MRVTCNWGFREVADRIVALGLVNSVVPIKVNAYSNRIGRKFQGFVDLFNVMNAGTALSVNQAYAATGTNLWMTPTTIMDGRYIRFGLQVSF